MYINIDINTIVWNNPRFFFWSIKNVKKCIDT